MKDNFPFKQNKNIIHLNDEPYFNTDFSDCIVVTYYTIEPYAGSGDMVIIKNNGVYTHDMGHCSCYGPDDHLDMSNEPEYTLDYFIDVYTKNTTIETYVEIRKTLIKLRERGII